MKPQVPDILSKFYDKHDPAALVHEIKTDDLPEIETLFRDNTSGIVWKVIAHSGGDVYESPTSDGYDYSGRQLPLGKKNRERMVILQSVVPEGNTMHIDPHVLKNRIHSSEHYRLAIKAQPQIARFEELEFLENNDAPFWKRGIKVMNTEKTLRKLTEAETTSLYVMNVYPTPHGLAELFVEYVDGVMAKVEPTWIPQDLLESIQKDALLKSQTFRRLLDNGMIVAITNGSAKRIQATPEYRAELDRLNETKPYSERYGK
jgi:hypothetical protein